VDTRPVQKPVHVLAAAGVAAEEPMVAENPQVARPSGRLVGHLGHRIRVRLALDHVSPEQPAQFLVVEAER